MNSALRYIATAIILGAAVTAAAQGPRAEQGKWELVEAVRDDSRESSATLSQSDQIETRARDGYIYITTPQPLTVKVFTILGQPVADGKVSAGTSRLRIVGRGIFILKAGIITRRITL